MCRKLFAMMIAALMWGMTLPSSAQNIFKRLDSVLTANYRKANYDTAYIIRPKTKWTVTARLNISGALIETEGVDRSASSLASFLYGQRFESRMEANIKGTLSLGVGYQGFTLSLALNPAKLMGKYNDYELNFNLYRRCFGFDFIYHDAKNFTGWYDQEGMARVVLPDGMLHVKTLNLNAYYAFNSRRFSYPAAFSQSYIQRRSAGSVLLAASGMWQRASLDGDQRMEIEGQKLRMTNIGIGAGYGYNFVPHQGWLLHLSLLPTFIVYNHATMSLGDDKMSLSYRFPEFIITGRAAVVRQWSNKFLGLTMVYNFTNVGDKDDLSVYNTKWRIRTFFGLRL